MKKLIAITAIVMMCSAPVFAANANTTQNGGFNGPTAQGGGFTGPGGGITTVEGAKSMRDDAWVTLRGNIVERLSDDVYTFKDATGTVNVDIDHKRWNGLTVGPQDLIEIQGEVDKDWNSVEIDVKQVSKVDK
ncbi:YgiW/YdeI family stress tolerance OB fold protein [Phytobacter sp. V91]|uniref:YgiW/YdeI family stress tolerance OB fold protein n=1 Tax=Phytobacter sp. V91 TaxID=3369425 RepID=UPI003F64483F